MEADRARLRPILMTTLAIIAGMLPVALGRGDGSASRASLATVVVGGQALCLLVTLLDDAGDLLDVRRHARAARVLAAALPALEGRADGSLRPRRQPLERDAPGPIRRVRDALIATRSSGPA